jgi:DNA adenine methylase/adenine-specific DNA-methyltransferase
MGSKYKLVPQLAEVFAAVGGGTALDAFSGSGVVAYTLKSLGYQVTANDFLHFPSIITAATVENEHDLLDAEDVDRICLAPAADDRDFIQRTFDGLYFTADDRAFLDSAWSHIDQMMGSQRALAISALILASARRQPRGVFTFTDHRYDDGRRDLRTSLREHFRKCAAEYNSVVFSSGEASRSVCEDVSSLSGEYELVHLDPPYAPPRDDNCYIKRYHIPGGFIGLLAWTGHHAPDEDQEVDEEIHTVFVQAHRDRGHPPDDQAVQGQRNRVVLLVERSARRHDD